MSQSRELLQKKAQELQVLSAQQNENAKEMPSAKAQEQWSTHEKAIATAQTTFLKQKDGEHLLAWKKAVDNANNYINEKLANKYHGDVNNKKVKERRSFIEKNQIEISQWQKGLIAVGIPVTLERSHSTDEGSTLKLSPPSSTPTPNNSPVSTVRGDLEKDNKVSLAEQKLNALKDTLHDHVVKITKATDLGELAKAQSTPKIDPSYRKRLLPKKEKSCCCCPFWNKSKKSSKEEGYQELNTQYKSIQA